MQERWSARTEAAGGGETRPRGRDAGLLVLAAARLADPRAAGAGARRRGRHCGAALASLAFIEVKARSSEEAAALALDAWRLRRVVVAAERLAPRYLRDGDELRIDAIFVVPGRLPRHLANVWLG
jgi:putative endonuclease